MFCKLHVRVNITDGRNRETLLLCALTQRKQLVKPLNLVQGPCLAGDAAYYKVAAVAAKFPSEHNQTRKGRRVSLADSAEVNQNLPAVRAVGYTVCDTVGMPISKKTG